MLLYWNELCLGCTRSPEFVQNFSEHQILWILCSVVFRALTLQLPIQTSISVMPELRVSLNSLENVQISGKGAHPWCL